MKDKIKELALQDVAASLQFTIEAVRVQERRLSPMEDHYQELERQRQAEHDARIAELDEITRKLRSLYQINLRVLNIVNAPAESREKPSESTFSKRFNLQ